MGSIWHRAEVLVQFLRRARIVETSKRRLFHGTGSIYRLPVAALLFGIGLTCLCPFAVGAAPILNIAPPPAPPVGVLGVFPAPNENAPVCTAGLLG